MQPQKSPQDAEMQHNYADGGANLLKGHEKPSMTKTKTRYKLRPCLVPFKIPKFYKISHHIESFNACINY